MEYWQIPGTVAFPNGWIWKVDSSNRVGLFDAAGNERAYFDSSGNAFLTSYSPLSGNATQGNNGMFSAYGGVSTVGAGVVAEYGLDNRSGLAAADGSPINLIASTPARTNGVYLVIINVFATAYSSGTATYTVTWTENSVSKTATAAVSALNTPASTLVVAGADSATAITGQLTGSFTATVKVKAVVLYLAPIT